MVLLDLRREWCPYVRGGSGGVPMSEEGVVLLGLRREWCC